MEESKRNKSVENAFSILRVIADNKGPTNLTDLSQQTGLHRSQLYRYLNSLLNLGVIIRHGQNSPSWSLGPELISLGYEAQHQFDLAIIAASQLKELCMRENVTIGLSIWGNRGPTFVYWEKSNKFININLDLGFTPLYSATGNVYRAFLPEETTDYLYKKEIENGKIDPQQYDEVITQVRKTGISKSESLLIPNVSTISAPIFNSLSQLAGVISIFGISGVLDTADESVSTKQLVKTASEISTKLKYKGYFPPFESVKDSSN